MAKALTHKQKISKYDTEIQELLAKCERDIAAKQAAKDLENKREQEKIKKAITEKYFHDYDGTERVDRLIQKALLTDYYLQQTHGSVEELKELLRKIVEIPDVAILIDLAKPKPLDHTSQIKKPVTDNKPEDNKIAIADNLNINDIPKIETEKNNITENKTEDNSIAIPDNLNIIEVPKLNINDIVNNGNNKPSDVSKIPPEENDILAEVTRKINE